MSIISLPFEDSRRLTGANLFFSSTGAVLEANAGVVDDSLLDGWRQRVARARERLGWPARWVRQATRVRLALSGSPPM